MLSFIYPIYNRADLFAVTLDSFVLQDDPPPYEIIVVDDGSTDHVRDVVRYYAAEMPTPFRLPIRYVRIDGTLYDGIIGCDLRGCNNPALAINVGIREARGERVVLTSPEVKHLRSSNVRRLAEHVLPPSTALVADVYDRTWRDTEFGGWIGGGPKQRALHFLVAFRRDDLLAIGGMEEAFMAGRGFEDNELTERFAAAGGRYLFTGPTVIAEHQPHYRAEPGPLDAINQATFHRLRGQPVANVGREWGWPNVIVERWP